MRITDKEDGLTHRMPAHILGWDPSQCGVCPYDDVTSIAIMYRTEMERLRALIPEEFEVTQPAVAIVYQKCNGVQWMGGAGYSLVAVSTPVRYLEAGDPLEGMFHHVLWEDKAAPILGGREEAGMPKVWADIPEYRRMNGNLSVNVSHEGRTFLEVELAEVRPFTPAEIAEMNENHGRLVQFGWRYIPKIGPFPGAALSEATYYPVDNEYVSGSVCTGSVAWTALKPEQHPMQFAIIGALASLPVLEYFAGSIKRGRSWMRMDLARSLPQVIYHD
ncbi:MAG: acetoacetate decarboxylase family protein [Methanomicrobiales archaeon]|nr:acetoacetate decarboxylase family protein [Methanomicrobiales archaeon]